MITYRALIKAHSEAGNIQEASELLDNMIGCGIVPDDSLYNTVIDRLCNQWKFDTGMKLYNEIERKGMLPSISSYMSLIRVLLKNCRKEEFNEILNNTYVKELASDVRTCNMLTDCLCMEDADFVMNLYDRMEVKGVAPNASTYNPVIGGLCKVGKVDMALKMHLRMQKMGFLPVIESFSTLIQSMPHNNNAINASQ